MPARKTLSLRGAAERQDAAPRHSWNVSETRRARLKEMARTVPFSKLPEVFGDFIDAKVSRRVVVDLNE